MALSARARVLLLLAADLPAVTRAAPLTPRQLDWLAAAPRADAAAAGAARPDAARPDAGAADAPRTDAGAAAAPRPDAARDRPAAHTPPEATAPVPRDPLERGAEAAAPDLGALLGWTAAEIAAQLGLPPDFAAAVAARLAALPALERELARLAGCGIQPLVVGEPPYPARLIARLGRRAPTVLFCLGDLTALPAAPGVGVVGSRQLFPHERAWAAAVGANLAAAGRPLISGAAVGADQAAMHAALAAGGWVLAFLPDSLESALTTRPALVGPWRDRLLLLSGPGPRQPFSAEAAHTRNRWIYALAHGTVVVTARAAKGGTWSGARAALSQDLGPLAVLAPPDAALAAGSRALLAAGAAPLPLPLPPDLADWLARRRPPQLWDKGSEEI
jgi:DNA processing protein